MDSHHRVLNLSANSSTAATPVDQSRRASHESSRSHNSTHDKTHKTLNQSIKKMWKDFKHSAAEHHRSVNAAYECCYGGGVRMNHAS